LEHKSNAETRNCASIINYCKCACVLTREC